MSVPTTTVRTTAAAVKAAQVVVPAWMDAFADDDQVDVTYAVTFAGRFVVGMVKA